MTNAVIYTQRKKALWFTDAMVAGFPAREVPSEGPGQSAPLHILGGLQFGCLELMRDICALGYDYVFWDNAYFGGGTQTDRLRITRRGYQKSWVDARPPDRAQRFGVELSPWRQSGNHIMVVPPGAAVRALFGLPEDWTSRMIERLGRLTDREIDVSEKGDPRPLDARLKGCHAVVTWSSNVAVLAAVAGVPVFCSPDSAAYPVAADLAEINQIHDKAKTPDRQAWLNSLAYGQFTIEEIRSGYAKRIVMEGAPQ